MKRILAMLMASAILLCCCAPTEPVLESSIEPAPSSAEPIQEVVAPQEQEDNSEMIKNGTFDKPVNTTWFTYFDGGKATLGSEDGILKLDIEKVGSQKHSVQLYQDIPAVTEGCRYRLTFDMRSTIPRTIEVRIQKNGGDYFGYLLESAKISTEVASYVFEFQMQQPTDPAPRFALNMGMFDEDGAVGAHTIYMDNVSLTMVDDSEKVEVEGGTAKVLPININQLGYRPADNKTVVFSGEDTTFDVVDKATGTVVYTGDITGTFKDFASGQTVSHGDFTPLTTKGEYYVKTAKLGESFSFAISEDVYDNAFTAVVEMFYMQRCGMELSKDRAGDFAHAACHTGLATVYGTNTKLDVSGGWHDAGDYGRYVVPGAKAAADLMLAYQLNPGAFANPLSSTIPVVVDEVRYELEWLLKMQDKASGGVYHKVTTKAFEGEVMPETVTEELVLAPISTNATGTFAAVMAMASTMYQPYDAAFSKRCLAAAEKAWGFTLKNPSNTFKNPEDILTGEYGDLTTKDERFWAAAELLKATGKKEYNDYIVVAFQELIPSGLGWASVGSYGTYAYLTTAPDKVDSALATRLKSDLVKEAKHLLELSGKDGYKISLGQSYPWGSNMSVANNAMLLLIANLIEPNAAYTQSAADHLNYLFGVNCLSYSFVTGFGTQSPNNTHHRPSMAIGKTLLGMLVGGPNSNLEDPFARAVLEGLPPAQCYADNAQSYSTNEITIYWNSPLVFLLSYYAKAY